MIEYNDRFIPNRKLINQNMQEYFFNQSVDDQDPKLQYILDQKNFMLFQKNYKNNIPKQQKKKQNLYQNRPFKILQCPDLYEDDNIRNLMHWGNNNVLAIFLQNSVYVIPEDYLPLEIYTLESELNEISSVQWMQNTNLLAIGLNNSLIQLFDVEKNVALRQMHGHSDRVGCLAWNNYVLSSGSKDSLIINHDIRQKNNIIDIKQNHKCEITQLKWSPNGKYLASASEDQNLMIWDQFCRDSLNKINNHEPIQGLDWCPYLTNVLALGYGSQNNCLSIWNINNFKEIRQKKQSKSFNSILFSNYQQDIITSYEYNQIQISTYKDLSENVILQGHNEVIQQFAQNPSGDIFASLSFDETLRFWKLNKNKNKDLEILNIQKQQLR